MKLLILPLLCIMLLSCSALKKGTNTAKKGNDTSISSIIITSPPVLQETKSPAACNPIVSKYAKLMKVDTGSIKNIRLFSFIDKWLNTPYRWGGTNKNGIDCSAFIQLLLLDVYSINIPRTSVQQFLTQQVEQFSSKEHLSEGDLVFFKTINNTLVSHVGLYLQNGKFINSSSSKGVSIANLNTPYWKDRYVAAGRIKLSMLMK